MIVKFKITGMKADGYNIVEAMLNDKIVYSIENDEDLLCLEYTIDVANDSDTLMATSPNPYYSSDTGGIVYNYLPMKSWNDADELFNYHCILITLIDGTETSDVNILANLVNRIEIYYKPTTTAFRMPFRVKSVYQFNTSNLTDLSGLFYDCYYLTSVNTSDWDTSNVTSAEDMFSGVSNITNWNYDGSNYANWTLTEEETGYTGTFPWNEE